MGPRSTGAHPMTEWGYLGAAVLAGAFLWTLVEELRWQRRYQREQSVVGLDDISLARRVVRTLPPPLVEASEMGVFIGSPDASVVADIISRDPAFYAREAA
jgi:hypothetical protein